MHLAAWFAAINSAIELNAGAPWVAVATFAFCLIDGFFPPVPSESLVVGLAAVGEPAWWLLLPVAAAGAVCGDNIAYWIGRRLGATRILTGGPKRRKMVTWARHQLRMRGPLCILVARYIPGGRVVVNALAGATRFSYKIFLTVDVIAGLAWAGYAIAIGAGASSLIGNNHLLAVAIGVVGAVLVGVLLDQVLRRLMPVRAVSGTPGQAAAEQGARLECDDEIEQDSPAA